MSTGESAPVTESPTLSVDTLLRNPKAVQPEQATYHDETLFSANSQFGRVTGHRLRRKGEKKQIVEEVDKDVKTESGLRNSHGGPVAAKMEKKKKELNCSESVGSHPEDLAILNTEFSACSDQVLMQQFEFFQELNFPLQVDRCGLNVEDKSAVEKYGVCINDR